ncbi:MAG TPA: M20/M25/M40 family metallo-hydrolase [Oceanospirillales bacterium]|nr:M20/M25/M40 family metallo-hydrolase [Oceanospirillales bacterium]
MKRTHIRWTLPILLIASLLTNAQAKRPSIISVDKAKTYEQKLTGFGGRLTGSESEQEAAAFIDAQMKRIGLQPWHSQSYQHPFEFTAGTNLGKNNKFSVNGQQLELNKDYRPLVFSGLGDFVAGNVVFAGYGITEPEGEKMGENYDSYMHLDVKDKWVLVMRFMPEDISTEQRIKINQFSSERNKVLNARQHGAKGVIFVHGPNTVVKKQLIPLTFDASTAHGSMPVVSITTKVAQPWFKKMDKDWQTIQKKLDAGKFVMGFDLKDVSISASVDLKQDKKMGHNVIGYIKGTTDLPAVILGAHYDHLGHGESSTSLARDDEMGFVHPGADDNASGVSGQLMIAEYLNKLKNKGKFTPKRDIIFAFWSGEELGLLGSNHFVKSFNKKDLSKIFVANLNMDMIGRLRDALVMQGTGSSKQWNAIIEQRNAPVGLNITLQEDAYLPTDAMSFYLYNVPVLSAFTGSHSEYHSPRDTTDLINYQGIVKTSKLVALIARGIANSDEPIVYQKQQRKKEKGTRGGMRAYLGTIPDYASEDGKGVLLSGATKGSPAEIAGIQSGDRIIELAGTKIENIYDFTYVLQALKVGKTVKAKVNRDGKEIVLEMTPSSRQ